MFTNKKNKNNFIIYILIIGFVIRFSSLFIIPNRPVENDAKYTIITAVNIANNNDYSHDSENPFFFREPVQIYFYASCIKLYTLLTNNKISTKSCTCNEYTWQFHDKTIQNAILFIRIIQSILQCLTLLLFYLIIIRFVDYKISILTVLILAIFPPYFLHIHSLLREVLNSFFLFLMTYIWIIFLENKKNQYLILVGILWGINALTFQIYLVIGVYFIFYILLFFESEFKNKFRRILFLIIAFIFVVSPWCIKVYNYYPDIRIVKTIGISLTHEQAGFMSAFRTCDNEILKQKYNDVFYIDSCEFNFDERMWYIESSKSHFYKSFNGIYDKQAKELINATSKEAKTKNFRDKVYKNIKQSFFRWGQSSENILNILGGYKYWKILFYIIGIIAIFGSFVQIWKFKKFNYLYFFHIGLFLIIGSEARRLIPIQPFVIFFGIMFINYIVSKLKLSKINYSITDANTK